MILSLLATLTMMGCGEVKPESADGSTMTYEESIETWRRERLDRLAAEDGWLALTGLYWLRPGINRFGAASDNELVFPEHEALAQRPGTLGELGWQENGAVVLETAPGSGITHAGKTVERLILDNDSVGDPTLLDLGPLQFHLIERGGDVGVRLRDRESPRRRALTELPSFPTNANLRLRGRFEASAGSAIELANVTGQVYDHPSPGRVVFDLNGQEWRLDAVGDGLEEPLFLIVGDRTNGLETYPGGRYLDADVHGEDGAVWVDLDFNKLYNPPCVYSEFATCPLPPPQNRLALRIEAGELWSPDDKP
jgi:hypothetical protein